MARRLSKRQDNEPLDPKKETSLERIIGRNSWMPAWFLAKGAEITRSVGRVVVKSPAGSAFGTGFLIPEGLLITCHHLIPSAKVANTSAVQFDYRVASNGSFSPLEEFALDPDRFFATHEVLDTTIVALTSPTPRGRAWKLERRYFLTHTTLSWSVRRSTSFITLVASRSRCLSAQASLISWTITFITMVILRPARPVPPS